MLATFMRRDLCVVFQIANSFIAAAPINPPTNPGPFAFNIRQSIAGVNRLPNWPESAISAPANDGKRARLRPIAMDPPTTAGSEDITGMAGCTGYGLLGKPYTGPLTGKGEPLTGSDPPKNDPELVPNTSDTALSKVENTESKSPMVNLRRTDRWVGS